MKQSYQQGDIIQDFSIFKWHTFLPGEIMDDLSVMKFHGNLHDFVPEQYFSPGYSIQIITSGAITISINAKRYELGPNSGYFITPDFLLHRPEKSNMYVEAYILSFSRKFVQEMNMEFKLNQIARIYAQPTWTMSEHKTQRIIHYYDLLREVIDDKNRPAATFLVQSLFQYLAGETFWDKQIQPTLSREEEIAGKFLVLVDENCEKEHALDWYASKLCLSTRHVANTVKQVLGMTASSCIEQALTQRAKTLLYTTRMTIQQITDQLGFQNQSHFGTFFKRHVGVSPAAFRKSPV